MTLEEHLTDLRKMFIRVLVILTISFFICYAYGDQISEWLLGPLRKALANPQMGQIIYTGLLDKLVSQVHVGFWSSLLFSSPLWFREIWIFVRPGLHDHEAKFVWPFLVVGFFLFLLGVVFAYYLVFPYAITGLLDFGVQNITAALNLSDYLLLSAQVLFFFGLIFQVPNVMVILGFMGLVTKYSLRKMRRYVYFGLAVFAAVITPADVISMLGLWLPLIVLFEIGILAVAVIVHPVLRKQVMDS